MLKKFTLWIAPFTLIILMVIQAKIGLAALSDFNQEETLRLSSVKISLWPEFDRAEMLVIYRITIPTDVFLPVEVRLRIPSDAGVPNEVAAQQPNGALVSIPYTQQPGTVYPDAEVWSWIIFNAITPEIQMEYYDPRLIINGNQRHFEYSWPGDYFIDNLKLEVQGPVGSKEMRVKPGMVTVEPGADGLIYYRLDAGAVNAGQALGIEMDYLKSNNKLSSAYIPVESSGPLDASTQGRLSVNSALPWIFGSLGFLLILGGALWYWRSGPSRHGEAYQKAFPDSFEGFGEEISEVGKAINCPVCGRRASNGDRFCRSCGKQLNSD